MPAIPNSSTQTPAIGLSFHQIMEPWRRAGREGTELEDSVSWSQHVEFFSMIYVIPARYLRTPFHSPHGPRVPKIRIVPKMPKHITSTHRTWTFLGGLCCSSSSGAEGVGGRAAAEHSPMEPPQPLRGACNCRSLNGRFLKLGVPFWGFL